MTSGAAGGTTGALSGAEIGGAIGMLADPVGATVGLFARSILGALFGVTACGVAGAKLGEVIDDKILDNYQCLACDYVFSQKTD